MDTIKLGAIEINLPDATLPYFHVFQDFVDFW